MLHGTVEIHETVCTAARRMLAERSSCLVTVEAGSLRGLVTDHDLVAAVLCDGLEPAAPIGSAPERPLVRAFGKAPAGEAVWLMERNGLRDLPVTDDTGEIVGIVAAVDALALVIRELSERLVRTPRIRTNGVGGVLLIAEDLRTAVPSIAGEASAREAAEQLRCADADALLVCDGSRAVGIVTQRDLLRQGVARPLDRERTCARELMSSPLVTAGPELPLEGIVERMVDTGLRRLVVAYDGAAPGIVTLRSLLSGFALELAARLDLARIGADAEQPGAGSDGDGGPPDVGARRRRGVRSRSARAESAMPSAALPLRPEHPYRAGSR